MCLSRPYRLVHHFPPGGGIQIENIQHFSSAVSYTDLCKAVTNLNETYAIRVVRRSSASYREHEAAFVEMVKKHAKLDHPNIVTPIAVIYLLGIPAIVRRFYINGNILEYIANNPAVDKIALTRGAAEGLLYMHSQGVAHGNISPSNLLITMEGVVRISDIAVYSHCMCSSAGPLIPIPRNWIRKSPQELESGCTAPPTAANDVYSFGITLFEVFTGKTLAGTYVQEIRRIAAHQPRLIFRPPPVNMTLWQLIQKCSADEVADRATMDEAVRTLQSLG